VLALVPVVVALVVVLAVAGHIDGGIATSTLTFLQIPRRRRRCFDRFESSQRHDIAMIQGLTSASGSSRKSGYTRYYEAFGAGA